MYLELRSIEQFYHSLKSITRTQAFLYLNISIFPPFRVPITSSSYNTPGHGEQFDLLSVLAPPVYFSYLRPHLCHNDPLSIRNRIFGIALQCPAYPTPFPIPCLVYPIPSTIPGPELYRERTTCMHLLML